MYPGEQRRRVCDGSPAGEGRGDFGWHFIRRERSRCHRSGEAPREQGQDDRDGGLFDGRTVFEHTTGGGGEGGSGRVVNPSNGSPSSAVIEAGPNRTKISCCVWIVFAVNYGR